MHCENLNVPQRAAQNNCGRRDKLNSTRLKYYVNQLYNLSNFQTRNIDRKWLPNKNIRRSHISARLIIDGGRSSKIKLKNLQGRKPLIERSYILIKILCFLKKKHK